MKIKTVHFLTASLAATGALDAVPIVYAEYVISSGMADNDPGLGQGTPIEVPVNEGSASLSLTLPPTELPLESPGTFLLSIRLRDADDLWTTHTRTFQIPAPLPPPPEPLMIDHVEAFITPTELPNMPAADEVVTLLSPPGAPLGAGVYSHTFTSESLSSLTPGVYRAGVRARTADGLWTPVQARTFAIPGDTEPQFYYPRWRVRNPEGGVIQSGALAGGALFSFPVEFLALLPVGGGNPGTHTVELSLEDLQGTPGALESRGFEVVTHADYWREMHFTDPAMRADPGISGPLADANGDGMTNLHAYVLGLDPETVWSPALRALGGQIGSPRAEVRVPWEIPAGGSLRLLASPDLASPFELAAEMSAPLVITHAPPFTGALAVDILAGHPRVVTTPPLGGAWDTRGFFRLEVEFSGEWPY